MLWRRLLDLMDDRRGNVAIIASLAAVPLFGATFGAIEVGATLQEKQALQAAVDQGALAGAGRMTTASDAYGRSGASDFAVSTPLATLQNAGVKSDAAFEVVRSGDSGAVTVNGTSQQKALIGFLGLGDQTLHATATAETLASVPLCILQTGTGNKGGAKGPPAPPAGPTPPTGPAGAPDGPALKGGISMNDQARIRATGARCTPTRILR